MSGLRLHKRIDLMHICEAHEGRPKVAIVCRMVQPRPPDKIYRTFTLLLLASSLRQMADWRDAARTAATQIYPFS